MAKYHHRACGLDPCRTTFDLWQNITIGHVAWIWSAPHLTVSETFLEDPDIAVKF
jgi:hypothetical protein